jgi:hypothetical protein
MRDVMSKAPVPRRNWKTAHWRALTAIDTASRLGATTPAVDRSELALVLPDLLAAELVEEQGGRLVPTREGCEAAFMVTEHVHVAMGIEGFEDPDPENEASVLPVWGEFPNPDVIRAHAGRFTSDLMYTRGDWMQRYTDDKGRRRTRRVALTVVGRTVMWDTGTDYGEGQPSKRTYTVERDGQKYDDPNCWVPLLPSGLFGRWPDAAQRMIEEPLILHPGLPLGDPPTEVRINFGGEKRLTSFVTLFEEMVRQNHDDYELVALRLGLDQGQLSDLRRGIQDLTDDGWKRVFNCLWPHHALTQRLLRKRL